LWSIRTQSSDRGNWLQDPKSKQHHNPKKWTKDPFTPNCFGYRKFIQRKMVKEEEHGFLKDDTLIIKYEMVLQTSADGVLGKRPQPKELKMEVILNSFPAYPPSSPPGCKLEVALCFPRLLITMCSHLCPVIFTSLQTDGLLLCCAPLNTSFHQRSSPFPRHFSSAMSLLYTQLSPLMTNPSPHLSRIIKHMRPTNCLPLLQHYCHSRNTMLVCRCLPPPWLRILQSCGMGGGSTETSWRRASLTSRT